MEYTNHSLKTLVDSTLHSRYSGILSLSNIPLFLADPQGEIVMEFTPSPDFCTHVCQRTRECLCEDYRYQLHLGGDRRFVCRHGLENILMPIVVEGKVMGCIGGMQVYLPDTEYHKYLIDISQMAERCHQSAEFVAKTIATLKTVEDNKVELHQQLCNHIVKNIALDLERMLNSSAPDRAEFSAEKEILEKKIIDLEAKNRSLIINPHFLFNTLNCIARIAYFEHSHTIEELIYCLSDLLRYNLKQEGQLHTISAEIDNIEKYLYIQKVRFKSRLEYSIEVPDEIKAYRIPNMVIQPIVENALIHGITPKWDGGKICISAEERKGQITIFITDNGNGFPKGVLEQFGNGELQAGLGISSTDKRLKKYYGEQYGVEIVKSDFSGSTVTITISTQLLGR